MSEASVPDLPVVVMGLMGAGKTTVASRLAQRWGRRLRDSDVDLEARFGRTAKDLAAERGKDGLHDLEVEVLLDALAEGGEVVVAAAASTVEREPARAALAPAVVVWLDAPPHVLVARQHVGGHRPQFAADLTTMLEDMDRVRRPLFEELADVTVHLPDRAPDLDDDARERSIEALVAPVETAVLALPSDRHADR